MPVRTHISRRRPHKFYKNGFPNERNGLSALQEEKLKEFRESFVEGFQETPLNEKIWSFLFYFYMFCFAFLRDFVVKLGLVTINEPKEYKNEVSKSFFF